MKDKGKRVHFVGIGGAGMCPLAEVMHSRGYAVTGSDQEKSFATERLESLGIKIQYNHVPELVKDCEILVYSSAINPANNELVHARKQGITVMKRADMLGNIMKESFSIGIAGTHGKTTTTSLIGNIFQDAGKNPTVIVGGAFRESKSNAIIGNGKLLITEADEYDRSFLRMFPAMAVVTNIERDHLDVYEDLNDIKNAFTEYVKRVPADGTVVLCKDDRGASQMYANIDRTVITYGTSKTADYQAENITFEKGTTHFDVIKNKEALGFIDLPLTGLHNVRNALAAIAVSCEMNVPFEVIKNSLNSFTGIKRRFEIIGTEKEITVIDDYAHHPTEILATLAAARNVGFKRLVAVFQPHLYSRTRDFLNEFAESLMRADVAVVTEIYRAREEPLNGVKSADIIEKMWEKDHANVHYVSSVDKLAELLVPLLEPGDGVILMGAGDIWKAGEKILNEIKNG